MASQQGLSADSPGSLGVAPTAAAVAGPPGAGPQSSGAPANLPATDSPVTGAPAASLPITEAPAASLPVAGAPAASLPATSSPAAGSAEHARRLLDLSLGLLRSRVLHTAAELGLADELAAGPLTCEALADRTECDPDALYRLLRALCAMGIFTELGHRSFALNDAAHLLRSDEPRSVRDLVRYLGAGWNMRTQAEMLQSVRTGSPAFDLAHGMPLFDFLARHDADARLFDAALSRFTSGQVEAVIASYDFGRFSKVVDVGGGNGELLLALLRKHPGLRAVLLDRADVVEAAASRFAVQAMEGRIELVAGNFFESVPDGVDACILKNVIHDWTPDDAVRVLGHCKRAVGAGGTVLVVETVLKGRNAGEFGKLMDVGMMVTTGGRERDESEYAALFESAGLKLLRVIPTKSPWSLLEAVPR